jgi:Acetyltransferase (GNAT) domain
VGLVAGADPALIGPVLARSIRAEAARAGASMVVFKDLPGSARDAFADPLSSQGFFVMASYPGTVVRLPPPDKQAYLDSLSHLKRHNLLKKLRRSSAALPLEVSVSAAPSAAEMAEITGLFLQTYEKGHTKFERLGRPFFEAASGRPETRFIMLRDPADGRLAAFMLVFVLGPRVINKFIGLDYGRGAKAFLYFRLFDAALDFAYACGASELQSGQTGYRAKLDLGHGLVPLFNLVRHRSAPVNALFRAIGSRVSWGSLDSDLGDYLKNHPGSGPNP